MLSITLKCTPRFSCLSWAWAFLQTHVLMLWFSYSSLSHLAVGVCEYACVLTCFSQVQLSVTLWTGGHKALLAKGFSKQQYWSGLPCPPRGDLPNPGIEPVVLALLVDSLRLSHLGRTRVGLHPAKPMLSWKYLKSEMHLVLLPYWTS